MKIQFQSSSLLLICFSFFIDNTEQCARTATVTTPQPSVTEATTVAGVTTTVASATTTTVAGETTTTAAATTTTTTTTAAPAACKTCGTLDFLNGMYSIPFASDSTNDSGACTTRTFVCTASTPDGISQIIPNDVDAGRLFEGTPTATITIVCNDQSQWIATGDNGVSVVLTSIGCDST